MSKFDKDLNVDDLILAYHKGIHRVVKIERRFYTKDDMRYKTITDMGGKVGEEYTALIHYVTIAAAKGNPKRRKATMCSDSLYCERALPAVNRVIQELQETIEQLAAIVGNAQKSLGK